MVNKNKARILQVILNSDSPVTFQLLRASLEEIPESVLWDNLQRMLVDRDIEVKSFREEGIDAQDYRLGEKRGRMPRDFYVETHRGIDKFRYFEEKGVV